MPPHLKPTGHPFRKWRLENDVVLKEAAYHLGVSVGAVSAIENFLKYPGKDLADKMSMMTGIPTEEIRHECPTCGRLQRK
jgi:transcriptional regulator with XRE-family HTH domain